MSDDIRDRAGQEFDLITPKPTPPDALVGQWQPKIVKAQTAHLWVDIQTIKGWSGKPDDVNAVLWFVTDSDGKAVRYHGEIEPDQLQLLVEELTALHGAIAATNRYALDVAAYEQAAKARDVAREEHIRRAIKAEAAKKAEK